MGLWEAEFSYMVSRNARSSTTYEEETYLTITHALPCYLKSPVVELYPKDTVKKCKNDK